MEVGSVAYNYRIARTEITATQWLDFVDAYAPYWHGSPSDPSFTSWWIYPSPLGYFIQPGFEQCPVEMSWRMAARYCNWLTNAKRPEQWAFESGAYDTSTFTSNPDGSLNDQLTHSPGALFWLPTRDEWTKAAYYDPNRNGPGQGGYWRFPDMSDDPLISGLPGAGGQTNAGLTFPSEPPAWPVGSYPNVQSPWGLLDVSGGVSEWTEDCWISPDNRYLLGTRMRDSIWNDRIDWWGYSCSPTAPLAGIRIASVVSEPSVMASAAIAGVIAFRGRRRVRSLASASPHARRLHAPCSPRPCSPVWARPELRGRR